MTRTSIILTISLVGWMLPIGIGIALWSAPSIVTREGDAGTFLTANVTPCGYGCDTLTNVHTSRGTFIVNGVFATALRGSALIIRDTTAWGLELCIDHDAGSCSPLASGYTGPLLTVAKPPFGLSHHARTTGIVISAFWIPFGMLALILFSIAIEEDEVDPDAPAPRD